MENFGTAPASVYGTVHGPGYCGDSGIGGELAADARLADGFHAYAVHWEPDRRFRRPCWWTTSAFTQHRRAGRLGVCLIFSHATAR